MLFLSFGGSLRKWQQQGILSREMALYLKFLEDRAFETVTLFSYHPGDVAYLDDLRRQDERYRGVEVIVPGKVLGRLGALGKGIHSLFGPVVHRRALAQASCLKTNQMSGSWSAVMGRLASGTPLLLRAGYVLSRRFAKNRHFLRARIASILEQTAMRAADRIVVTSRDAEAALSEEPRIARKLERIPSYVDVSRFRPVETYSFDQPVLYVGRLVPQKNILNLVQACMAAELPLDLIGTGPLDDEIRTMSANAPAPIRLLGQVDNNELADRMRSYSVFALPSHHEGLPKVLIEAMATGLVCVGTKIPGIIDLIEDGKTGYLIPSTEAQDIADALKRAHTERRPELGQAARELIVSQYSLEAYTRRELNVYGEIAAERG